jgi:cobalt-zinc-cadmium efflux system membrane fusion protein
VGNPARGDAATSIPLLGEIRFDGNRLARVTPLSKGVLAKVYAEVGQIVEPGEVLAIVNAPGAAEAKAAYLSAKADLQMWQAAAKRQRRLFDDKVGSRRAVEEAEASYSRAQVASTLARQRLQNLGFRESELSKIRDSRSALYLRSPFQGSIVSRSAVLGEAVDTNKALFEIADLSQMWVELSVPEEHAALIQTGTPIKVSVRASQDLAIDGRITWVSPVVDEKTRMVRARATLPNDQGLLRHGMFADVTAIIETHPDSVRLPSSAVHRIDNLPFVFVRTEPDLFAARRVGVGDRLPSDEFVVHDGVDSEDAVVLRGGFVIKSALLASRLGAGCTDD